MVNDTDSFTSYAVVRPGTSTLLHWVVYHRKVDAEFEARQWLSDGEFEVKEIRRRMRVLHTESEEN
jgi:hypothetical protein